MIMRRKNKIIPGYVYSMDSENKAKLDDIPEFTKIVEVVRLIQRNRSVNGIWLVRDIDTSKEFTCHGCMLNDTRQVVVRNPVDMPTINQVDLLALDNAIKLVEIVYNTTPDEESTKKEIKKRLDSLLALSKKLEWYYAARNI